MWRAYVENDWMADRLKIGLMRRGPSVATLVDFTNVLYHDAPIEGGIAIEPPYEPLRLDEGAARALLDALLTHFRMTRADENLRVDYLAERARVDKLIDAQIAGAQR